MAYGTALKHIFSRALARLEQARQEARTAAHHARRSPQGSTVNVSRRVNAVAAAQTGQAGSVNVAAAKQTAPIQQAAAGDAPDR